MSVLTHKVTAGPCIGLDTACSSSLVATHLAHRGLLNGETTAAVAAGVNLMLVASTTTNLAALGALSPNGRSKTFEATADGYGRGEGCVVVAMRLANGDGADCHAILQGELATQLILPSPFNWFAIFQLRLELISACSPFPAVLRVYPSIFLPPSSRAQQCESLKCQRSVCRLCIQSGWPLKRPYSSQWPSTDGFSQDCSPGCWETAG